MKENQDEPKVLLDCDVVIHFLKGQKILELEKIFPGRFVMLDKVHGELMKRNGNFIAISVFLGMTGIPRVPMPTDKAVLTEYLSLKKVMDEGEAACLAVARHTAGYVASSNISQITNYCKTHNIRVYTTMDLLVEAIAKGVMTEQECNDFITLVKANHSKLPCNTMAEYSKIAANKT